MALLRRPLIMKKPLLGCRCSIIITALRGRQKLDRSRKKELRGQLSQNRNLPKPIAKALTDPPR